MKLPTFHHEQRLAEKGYQFIAGVDEVGCGALAGPVMAGAVILPKWCSLEGVKDSKAMTPAAREALFPKIQEVAIAWSVGSASVEEIAQFNIRQATFLAMKRAIEQLQQTDHLLVDAWDIPGITLPQASVVKGDQKVLSIAAASIIAKVIRDRLMADYHDQYPEYGFRQHKGYATAKHREAIQDFGPCPIHRLTYKTFQPPLV